MSVGFKPPAPPKPRPPRELLFECYSAARVFYRCELITYPDGAAEIQFIEAPDDLRYARRFMAIETLTLSKSARDQAIDWANGVRRDLETGRFNP